MAGNQHGGYRRPNNPAPVSGPGALSKRTDGGPQQPVADVGGFEYGGRKDFADIQGGAPMAAADKAAPVDVTPLFAPTSRPNEPVTSGVPIGPGPGPAQAGRMPGSNKYSRRLQMLAAYDDSGDLGFMADLLAARGL